MCELYSEVVLPLLSFIVLVLEDVLFWCGSWLYLIVILWWYLVGSTLSVEPPSRKDDFYGIEIFIPCYWQVRCLFHLRKQIPHWYSLTCDLKILWSLLVAKEKRETFINKKCVLMCQGVSGAYVYTHLICTVTLSL